MMRKLLTLILFGLGIGLASAQTITNPSQVALVCAYNSAIPSPTSGQYFFVQCDSTGKLITTASSTIVPGTTPAVCATAGSILYSDGTVVQCAGAVKATSLALGSATIGTHDLALAGTALFGSVILRGPSAGALYLGAADAAAPVAQTIGVQSVAAGTSNTAGAVTTFMDSGSTGTAISGGFAFQGTSAGSSGSTQNTRINILRLGVTATSSTWNGIGAGQGTVTIGTGSSNLPVLMPSGNGGVAVGRNDNGPNVDAAIGLVTSASRQGVITGSGGAYMWANAVANLTTSDTYLTRPAAATIQHGLADAAAPVAQTIATQGVVAGTSNTAGVNLTIRPGAGTGTGAGGSLVFNVAPAGSTGSSQNAFATAWTIDSNKFLFPGVTQATNMTTGFINVPGAAGAPSGTPANTTGFPLYWDSTNLKLCAYTGGAWKCSAAFT